MRLNTPLSNQRLLVGIATYNEIENLPTLVEQVFAAMSDFNEPDFQTIDGQVLVVDDNSPDGTGRWCAAQTDPRFHCLVRAGKLGLGTAVIATMKYAIDHDFDWLLTMDADHSHAPAEMHRLLSAIDDRVDVVIGSRYIAGGKIVDWPWYRRMASRLANAFARRILGVQIADCSGGFRCYRVAKLRELDFDAFSSTGYSFYEEIVWRLQRQNTVFVEVPITFTDRSAGESKAGLAEVSSAVMRLLTLRLRG